MGKFDRVLLACDFDNTLVYTEPALVAGEPLPSLTAENRAALESFTAQGGHFAVATGRALAAFQAIAPGLPINTPCVLCNGAALYDFARGEYLDCNLLDEAALRRGQALLDDFPTLAVEAYHIGNVVHAVRPNEYVRRHEHLTHVGTEEKPSLLEVPLPLGKFIFEDDHATLQAARRRMTEWGWDANYEIVFSRDNLLEVTAKGANKGGMVLRLAERLGIAREDVCCMGDEANDLSMLRAAGHAFAPANGTDAVKAVSTVVSHAESRAVADVVDLLDRLY